MSSCHHALCLTSTRYSYQPIRVVIAVLVAGLLICLTKSSPRLKTELSVQAAQPEAKNEQNPAPDFVPGEILVKLRVDAALPETEVEINPETAKSQVLSRLHQKGIIRLEKVIKGAKSVKPKKSAVARADGGFERLYKLHTTRKNQADVLRLVEELKQVDFIEAVSPNYFRFASVFPDDPLFSEQWGLEQENDMDIDAPAAWDTTTGASSSSIAVVDTGIHLTHPDLANKIFQNPGETGLDGQGQDKRTNGVDDDGNGYIDDAQGWNTTDCTTYDFATGECAVPHTPGPDAADDIGHGTHVAGIIGAETANTAGMAGIDWQAKLLPVKVLNFQGIGTCDSVLNGIYYALQFADVVNLSLGGDGEPCAGEEELVNYAADSGVVLVAAAGNRNSTFKSYPAGFERVIAVAATDRNGSKATFSNYGGWIDLTAPGVDILSTLIPGRSLGETCGDPDGDGFGACSGTSMATPFVSGVAGLILARNPAATATEVTNILLNAATDLLPLGKDVYSGYGLVNAEKAVTDMDTTPPPVYTISYPYDEMPIGNRITIEGTIDVVNFERYAVDYAHTDTPDSWQTQGITLTDPGREIQNGVLAIWNTQVLPSGSYLIRLTVSTVGGKSNATTAGVIIDRSIADNWPIKIDDADFITAADVTGDKRPEIIIQEKERLNVFGKSGSQISPAFPITLPASYPYWYTKAPTVGNLDNDSNHPGQEIVYSIFRNDFSGTFDIYAVHADGTLLPGWPKNVFSGGNALNNQPLADLNSDGLDDIIYLTRNTANQVLLVARDGSGTILSGWENVVVNSEYTSFLGTFYTPVVGNINSDPRLEIVVSYYEGQYPNGERTIKAFTSGGSLLWTFPIPGLADTEVYDPYVSMGDLNNDGIAETVVLVGEENNVARTRRLFLYVLDQNGVPLLQFNRRDTGIPDVDGSVIVGDVDRDGSGDILINNSWLGHYSVFNYEGEVLPGWPIIKEPFSFVGFFTTIADLNFDNRVELTLYGRSLSRLIDRQKGRSLDALTYDPATGSLSSFPTFPKYFGYGSSPYNHAVADLDGDGRTELVILSSYPGGSLIYVYSLANRLGSLEWPMYFHDAHHTGAYFRPANPLDVNGDGEVNYLDYREVLQGYQLTGCTLKADFDGNCKVNAVDFGFFRK